MDITAIGKTAATNNPTSSDREVVAGRVLQFDADFACYEVADLEAPVAKDMKALIDLCEMRRKLVGAETINCFITLGYKSGREHIATRKPYQENRDPDKPIKVRVRELRNALANYESDTLKVIVGHFYEADDLMCREQTKCNAEGGESIIMSGDKDLWMIQGKHACAKTGRMWTVKGYGHTEYREVGNVKPKLVGEGTSWFWHQMIMGDKVDNIPGLEKLSNKTLDIYSPLKSGKPRKTGSGLCGEAKAVMILNGITDDIVAAKAVYVAYWEYYGAAALERFVEQAYLLWMQRTDNVLDVLTFLQACGIRAVFTQTQLDALHDFLKLADGRI